MEEIILETKELCKQYHKQTVLKNTNMRIPKGCVYGLLGANGAGKSTLMKILCGMTRAAAGKKQTIQFECENLVYNAIEYTPQGGMIRICISEGNEQLEISVEDEGSGFSAEDLQSAKNCFIRETKADIPGNITGWACIWQSNLQKKTEEVLHWPTLRG